MTTNEAIKDMRRRCRLAMNGVASSNMRSYGLDYKLNFGVSLPKIKEIAAHYSPDRELAETLWLENVRELKILATLLYPAASFDRKTADAWLADIDNQEMREQVCLNLFQKLPFAEALANEWSNCTDESVRTIGYWLSVRLLLVKQLPDGISAKDFAFLFADAGTVVVSLRNAAILLLKQLVRASATEAKAILAAVSTQGELYDTLNFEFEYYHQKV